MSVLARAGKAGEEGAAELEAADSEVEGYDVLVGGEVLGYLDFEELVGEGGACGAVADVKGWVEDRRGGEGGGEKGEVGFGGVGDEEVDGAVGMGWCHVLGLVS